MAPEAKPVEFTKEAIDFKMQELRFQQKKEEE